MGDQNPRPRAITHRARQHQAGTQAGVDKPDLRRGRLFDLGSTAAHGGGSVPQARQLRPLSVRLAAAGPGRARWFKEQMVARTGVSVARVPQIERGDVSTQDVLNWLVTALGGTLKLIADYGDEQLKIA